MQAIMTKYLPATNTRGSRIKEVCERGALTVSHSSNLEGVAAHIAAANQLVAKFCTEDVEKYGTPPCKNPWGWAKVCGQMPDGSYAHVFVGGGK